MTFFLLMLVIETYYRDNTEKL